MAGFRDFLRRKYTPAQRRQRLGFDNVDNVNPPQWNAGNRPEKLRVISDPGDPGVDRFPLPDDGRRPAQMAAYAKVAEPGGGDRDQLRRHRGRRTAPGRRESTMRGCFPGPRPCGASRQQARAFGRWAAAVEDPQLQAGPRIPQYPFGLRGRRPAVPGRVAGDGSDDRLPAGQGPLDAATLAYTAFYRANRGLFRGTRDEGGVAVLRSYASITYDQPRQSLAAILAEQALIEGHVPFELVFDRHLADLTRYKVLVLPDAECLSDQQIAAIRGFVERGGSLVATGKAGLYDQWRRLRVTPGLAGLIDGQSSGRDYEEDVSEVEEAGVSTRKEVGKGRSVYLPSLRFDGPLPSPEAFFTISNRYWKRPANSREFLEALRWAARDELPVGSAARRTWPSTWSRRPRRAAGCCTW